MHIELIFLKAATVLLIWTVLLEELYLGVTTYRVHNYNNDAPVGEAFVNLV